MKTHVPSGKDVSRKWHIIDAEGATLGRLATKAARILMGKHKTTYTPYLDMGDHVIVINAGKVRLTGNKTEQKVYYYHTGYPGGLKATGARDMKQNKPARMIELAVKGMLPKNTLGKHMGKKLKVYANDRHPHQAQKPEPTVPVSEKI
ncbi:50S ribosomal protein L13 [Bryobacter aggregatus]|uniref:50S ribosomal protein L13 n=1 Tax=Bryobacter aggregatus TaxID=360054 RepID=UPI0004E10B76|nr:50S ribosomal protein L13 [Bryobacter aggregatus]